MQPNGAARQSNSRGFRRGIADVHVALVVEDVAADDEVKRWHVQRGGVDGVCAGLFDDAQLVALRGKDILVVGFGQHNPGRQLPGPELAELRYRLGLLAH
jgi:hypothetical protein